MLATLMRTSTDWRQSISARLKRLPERLTGRKGNGLNTFIEREVTIKKYGKNQVWLSVCGKFYARQVGHVCQDCEVWSVDGLRHWVHSDENPMPLHCVVGWGNRTEKGTFAFNLSFVDTPAYAPRWDIYKPLKHYTVDFRRLVSFYHLPKWLNY